MLDELDETWANLARTDKFVPSLGRADSIGLRKMGPLVLPSHVVTKTPAIEAAPLDESRGMPTMVFLALNEGRLLGSDLLMPDFFFAVKVRKAPWCVTRIPGTLYTLGMAWRDTNGELIWEGFYASVHQGVVVPAHELHYTRERVGYVRRHWAVSGWKSDQHEAADCVKSVFAKALTAYQTRGEKWNVSVRKAGRRAVFLVEPTDTAYFFKDRDKTALAADGKAKRILHFVNAHQQHRANGAVVEVPDHIRGARSFTWNGYECAITAPKFHKYHALQFNLAGEDVLESEPDDPGMLSLSRVADTLVPMEDENNVRLVRRLKGKAA